MENIETYIQSTPYTCVASSYLMVLHHFFPETFPLGEEEEMYLHDKIRFWKGGDGEYGSYPKLARHSLRLGLEVKLQIPRIGQPEFMSRTKWSRYMKEFLPIIKSLEPNSHFQYVRKEFTVQKLLEELNEGRIPILEIKYPTDDCTHHVVIYGENEGKILVADPIAGLMKYSTQELTEVMEISYMKNFISLRKRNNHHLTLAVKGLKASLGEVEGLCRVIQGYTADFQDGEILVAPRTDPDMTPNMISSKGIITDQGGTLCHAAIVSREIGVPCIVGTNNATKRLRTGDKVYLDADAGRVYKIE
ncbi:peptidase C39 family protein [Candidatus Woesearchaeota archaeon]|nr:peptidase C39 family protein [Candidatus Woesearchaeota archaeon]